MTGNLVADLIALVLVYAVARVMIDRNVARRVVVSRVEETVGAPYPHTWRIRVSNLSTEPIYDLIFEAGFDWVQDEAPASLKTSEETPKVGRDFVDVIAPGETVTSGWMSFETMPQSWYVSVKFRTVRGRLHFVELAEGTWKEIASVRWRVGFWFRKLRYPALREWSSPTRDTDITADQPILRRRRGGRRR
jgi:hypothetical protein